MKRLQAAGENSRMGLLAGICWTKRTNDDTLNKVPVYVFQFLDEDAIMFIFGKLMFQK